MALFFDYKIQTPISEPNFKFFEWHNTFPILAIASYSRNTTGQVHIHFEEVRPLFVSLKRVFLANFILVVAI